MNNSYFAKSIVIGLLLGILVAGNAVSSTLDEVKTLNWDIHNADALNALLPNKTTVETFLKEYKPDLAEIGLSVGEYEISNLGNDGRLELVATIDISGRAMYNTIYVLQKINNKIHISEIWVPGINVLDLKLRIVDLNDDGVKELLLPRLLSYPQFETDPRPIINDVYEWDGTEFHKANASFKDYYRSLLPRLKSEHEAIIQGRKLDVPSQKALLDEKYKKEIEEVNRILNE